MNIEKDSAVSMKYTLKDGDGNVIDSSQGSEPLAYLHGHGNLVPGVERALEGQAAGAHVDVVVSPEDGYGERDSNLDGAIPKDAFPEDVVDQLAPGVMFQGPHPVDQTQMAHFTVMEVTDSEIRCTANHPLAGVTLHFDIDIVDVREATTEELAHGHIHGPGGHNH